MADWRETRMAELEAVVERQAHPIETLPARVEALEERVRRSSKNSSNPPSSDAPKRAKRAPPPTGKRPGGQPSPPKHERPLALPNEVNERVVVKPPSCERCARVERLLTTLMTAVSESETFSTYWSPLGKRH